MSLFSVEDKMNYGLMKRSLIAIAVSIFLSSCSSGSDSSSNNTTSVNGTSTSTSTNSNQAGSTTTPTGGSVSNVKTNYRNTNPVTVGFYGQRAGQVQETQSWVNMAWECFWDEDNNKSAIESLRVGVPTLLDLYGFLYKVANDDSGLLPDAEARVRAFFDTLKAEGVLKNVAAVTAIDEPNLPERKKTDSIYEASALLRRVLADYEELKNTKLVVMYCTHRPMIGIELFDIVYFDNYNIEKGVDGDPNKDPVLVSNGWADQVDKMLRPDQEMGLVPNCSDKRYIYADLDAFVAKAQTFKRKVHIAAFAGRLPKYKEDFLVSAFDQQDVLAKYKSTYTKLLTS